MTVPLTSITDYLYKKALGFPETNIALVPTSEEAYFSKPNNFIFQNYAQVVPTTLPTDFGPASLDGIVASNRANSSSYPYLYRYTYLSLTSINSLNNSFYSPYLTNVIPKSYNSAGNYAPQIYTNNLGTNLTTEAYILDPDSGVITFFPGLASVTASLPPKISCYRYEGLTGNPGIASLQDL